MTDEALRMERDMLAAELAQAQAWKQRLWREAEHHAAMVHRLADTVERELDAPPPAIVRALSEARAVNYTLAGVDLGALRRERDALAADLAASQQCERTASEAYHRQQSAQRELEALYQRAVESKQEAEMEVSRLLDERDALRERRDGWKRVAKMYRAKTLQAREHLRRSRGRFAALRQDYESAAAARDALQGEAAGCREVHSRLDAAGVPSARRVACDDPTCQTQAGHRVKLLIAERDAFAARVAALEEALGYADHAPSCDLWDGGRDCSCGWSETAAALRGKEGA